MNRCRDCGCLLPEGYTMCPPCAGEPEPNPENPDEAWPGGIE